jgi:hypothetical protein
VVCSDNTTDAAAASSSDVQRLWLGLLSAHEGMSILFFNFSLQINNFLKNHHPLKFIAISQPFHLKNVATSFQK